MRLVHATGKTMYVISLSNISIKMNFKRIARVELKCIQYSEGNYILCMTWFNVHSFILCIANARLYYNFQGLIFNLYGLHFSK
jgi:hypothetical protein